MSMYQFLAVGALLSFSACAGNAESIETVNTNTISTDSTGENPVEEKADTVQQVESGFSWNEKGFNVEINIEAYIDDPDKKGPTNIREYPGNDMPIM